MLLKESSISEASEKMGWLVKPHETVDEITLGAFNPEKIQNIASTLLSTGFYIGSKELGPHFLDLSSTWHSFSATWDMLSTDQYMQDKGKYRKRSYSTMYYSSQSEKVLIKPYMPLYKSKEYNHFAGDIFRYFDKTDPILYKNQYFQKALSLAASVFDQCEITAGNANPEWFIEVDQYRIEANASTNGKPTPEGIHSDGTSYFLLMLVDRKNIEGGISSIYTSDLELVGETTLAFPGDMMLIDDLRMLHAVSDINSNVDYANRDVLHISFTNLNSESAIKRRFGLTNSELENVHNLRSC